MTIAKAVFTATLTSYAMCDGYTPCHGITASGAPAVAGHTVAADWHHHPAGTRLWIDGLGYRVVDDTGSAIVGPARLDVFMATVGEARAFGVQQRRVRIEAPDDTQPLPTSIVPTPTARTGRVPVATYCDPITPTATARALAQATPTLDELTPTPPASDTATVTPVPSITSPPFPSATTRPTRTPTDVLPTFVWPTDSPEPTGTDTSVPTQTPWVVTVQVPVTVEVTRVVTATPDAIRACLLIVRGRVFVPWAVQRRRR